MAEGNDEMRPRIGELRRRHPPGREVVPVRFVRTADPLVFVAVTIDGERIAMLPGDQLLVDLLGPGQSVSTDLDLLSAGEPPEDYDYRTTDPS